MKDSFLEVSKILTGYTDLKQKPAEVYYAALLKNLKKDFTQLLTDFENKVRNKKGVPDELVKIHLWQDAKNKKICQIIIRAWYNAALSTASDGFDFMAPSEIYYEALVWKAIEAHPPGLSGGYFGYWRYAPEN
jgi:hypothetical protein